MSVDHPGLPRFIFIQKLNIINIGFLVMANHDINVRFVSILNLVPAFRMVMLYVISYRYCKILATGIDFIVICGLIDKF